MFRNSIKIIVAITLLLASLYLLFPWWISWLISLNLPSNMTLQSFDSQYPGTNAIHVNKMLVDIDGNSIALRDFSIDYSFKGINIEEVKILFPQFKDYDSPKNQAFNINDIELANLTVPQIPFKQLEYLEDIKLVNIEQLSFNIKNNDYVAKAVKLSQNHQQFNLRLEDIKYTGNKEEIKSTGLVIELQIDKLSKSSKLVINDKQQPFLTFNYSQTKNIVEINFKLNSEKLKNIFPDLLVDFPVGLKGDTTVQLTQNSLSGYSDIKINGELIIEKETISDLKTQRVDFLVVESGSNSAKDLTLQIMLDINLNVISEQLSAKMALINLMPQDVILKIDNGVLNVEENKVVIKSAFEVFNNRLKEKQVRLVSNTINISSPKIRYQDKNDTYSVYANNVFLDVTTSPFESSLFNLENANLASENNQWELSAKVTSSNFQSNHNQKNAQVSASLASNFKVSGSSIYNINSLISNGHVNLDRLNILTDTLDLNGELSIDWNDLESNFSKGDLSILLDTSNNKLSNISFDSLTSKTTMLFDHKEVKGKVLLNVNQQPLIPSEFVYDKSSGELSAKLVQNQINHILPNYFLNEVGKSIKTPLKIVSGEVQHSGNFKLNEQKNNILSQLTIKDMLFQFGENDVQGINMKQVITSYEPLNVSAELSIEEINFSSGMNINNLTAQIVAYTDTEKTNIIDVKNIRANLFEGLLESKSVRFHKGELLQSKVNLKQLSLTELIFFMDISGLYAEGEIDLVLPIATKSGRLAVENGSFKAIGKGIIKYSSGADDLSQEENIAIKALKNFHYKTLDGTVSYNRDGVYHIKLHLLGSNPDVYNGYPIDFILNLNGELSGVFRSLFLTGNFEEAVMQQIKTDQLEENTDN